MFRSVCRQLTGTSILLIALTALACGPAHGAGFALLEQGVKGMGNAYAGGAAAAEDATTVFFNPAGMSLLKGMQADAGLHVIDTSFKFDDAGSTHALQPLTGQGLTGGDGGNGGTRESVPNLYLVRNLDNGWAFGLGINVPFGLTTDWDAGWVGRYYALKSSITTVNINPGVAFAVNRHLSIGAGISAMYMDTELSQAIDFGTIFYPLGGTPQRDDGKVTLKADDWSFGFNIGILYRFDDATRIGASYRSRVKQQLTGHADYDYSPEVAAMIAAGPYPGFFQDGGAKSEVTLPDTASLSIYHRVNKQLALMADVSWTGWSTMDELRITFASQQPDSVTTLKWQDAWRIGVGATYSVNDRFDLRCGTMYDQSPVSSAAYRTPRLPDQDRLWTNIGGSYALDGDWSVDLAYAHVFMLGDADIDTSPVGENATRGGLRGSFDNSADIFSAQINYLW
jgi:long-chain fatty acid transport protein